MKRFQPPRTGLGGHDGVTNDRFKRARLDDDDDIDIDDDEPIVKPQSEALGFQEDLEEDPLEAFMKGLAPQAAAPAAAPSAAAASGATGPAGRAGARGKNVGLDEDDDHVAGFMEARKRSGAPVATGGPSGADYNSDEEVYAAAARAEARGAAGAAAAAGYDSDGLPLDPSGKKQVEPLAPVDHSSIEYEDFSRDLYEEAPEISRLTESEVAAARRAMDVSVSGSEPPRPVETFQQCFRSDPTLLQLLKKAGYDKPTPIQRQVLPAALSGRDVLGLAKTGSGKTAAYVLPLIPHLMDQRELEGGEGPIAIVAAPTRELAEQVHKECVRFFRPYGLGCVAAFGGLNKYDQIKALRAGAELAVCTPGRMIDLIRGGACNLRRVTYLVLDEADRMLDMGFGPQVFSLVHTTRPDRQTLLFSATMPRKVEALAGEALSDPVRVAVGAVGAVNADVAQVFHVFPSDADRQAWLPVGLPPLVDQGEVIVFANSRQKVDSLLERLTRDLGLRAAALHGDLDQASRMDVLHRFRTGAVHVLVATDIAARGLDIRTVRAVVNYEVPKDVDTFVHRVGRTGRAGDRDGTAVTLLLQGEERMAAQIAASLTSGGVEVPPGLAGLAKKDARYRKGFGGGRGRGGGGGGGRGGGGGGSGGKRRPRPLGGVGIGFDAEGPGGPPAPPMSLPPVPMVGPAPTSGAGLSGFSHAHDAYTAEMATTHLTNPHASGGVVVVPGHHGGGTGALPPPPVPRAPPQPPPMDPLAHQASSQLRSQFVSSSVVGGNQNTAPVVIMPKKKAEGEGGASVAPPRQSGFGAKVAAAADLVAEAAARARALAEAAAAARGGGAGSDRFSQPPQPPPGPPPPPPPAAPSRFSQPAQPYQAPPQRGSWGPPAQASQAYGTAAPVSLPPVPVPMLPPGPPPGPGGAAVNPMDAVERARQIAESIMRQQQAQQPPGQQGGSSGRGWGRGGGRGRGNPQDPGTNGWAWGRG